jgi:hypothetical protein
MPLIMLRRKRLLFSAVLDTNRNVLAGGPEHFFEVAGSDLAHILAGYAHLDWAIAATSMARHTDVGR